MKVWFDHQVFAMQVHGGVSRYFTRLAQQFQRLGEPDLSVIAPFHVNRGLRDLDPDTVTGMRLPALPGTSRLLRSINKSVTRALIRPGSPDIYHASYYDPPVSSIRKCNGRLVVTVYDMIHERYPQYFAARDHTAKLKEKAIGEADKIICISETTRNDLINHYHVDETKVSVTHLGVGLGQQCSEHQPDIEGTYMLFVGGRSGYKNFERLLRVYALREQINRQCKLVCFGGGALTAHERRMMSELKVPDGRVIQVSGDDELLSSLYQNAVALIYPSLYEGFGIPTLEAMSLDCPVIASTGGSLPEVVGDAACLFDPHDDEALTAAINKVLDDTAYRHELIESGRKRALLFSWEKCARQTLDLYRELI